MTKSNLGKEGAMEDVGRGDVARGTDGRVVSARTKEGEAGGEGNVY